MKFQPKQPPRAFEVGHDNKVTMQDCGALHLGENEQITFHTQDGGEFDVARKSWGFYATPSMNSRLKNFGLRSVLVRNRDHRFFVLLVENSREMEFQAYAAKEPLSVICWLDETSNLERIEALFRGDHG